MLLLVFNIPISWMLVGSTSYLQHVASYLLVAQLPHLHTVHFNIAYSCLWTRYVRVLFHLLPPKFKDYLLVLPSSLNLVVPRI
jgi:hypothetical protein